MHVDADDIFVGANFGDFDQRLAATETDVEDDVDGSPSAVPNSVSNDNSRTLDGDSPPLHRPPYASIRDAESPRRRGLNERCGGCVTDGWDRHGTMMVTAANVQG